mgnify:CR=1 FL=1
MQLNLAKRWPNWPTNNLAWWHFAILVSGIYLFFFYLFPLSLANNERIYRYAQLLTGPTFILLISALIISFLLLWSLLNSAPKISTKNALIFIAICAIPFLFVYPGDSADTFANIWYAKRVVDLGENPYVTSYVYETYQDIQTVLPPTSDSPLLPYGPLWLGFQSSIYFVTKSLSLIPMLFTFKLIQLTGVLLTAFFCTKLGSLFAKPDQANIVTTVVFASPFMLLGFVGNGHSDIWLALCLVISFYLLFKERILLGLFMFTASVLVKYISLIFAPFIILYLWHRYRRGVLNDLAVWGVFSSFVGLLFASSWHH